jgi:hypothetical protein
VCSGAEHAFAASARSNPSMSLSRSLVAFGVPHWPGCSPLRQPAGGLAIAAHDEFRTIGIDVLACVARAPVDNKVWPISIDIVCMRESQTADGNMMPTRHSREKNVCLYPP